VVRAVHAWTLVELWHGARGAKEKRELAETESEIERVAADAAVWRLSSKKTL
jgi:hypothetical protein